MSDTLSSLENIMGNIMGKIFKNFSQTTNLVAKVNKVETNYDL